MRTDHTATSCVVQDDILMWGGYAGRETRPQHVASNWSLAAEFMPNFTLMVSKHLTLDSVCITLARLSSCTLAAKQ